MLMRAKMKVEEVSKGEGSDRISMRCVCGTNPFGSEGESDDNTFARWTPSGQCTLVITNPALLDEIRPGQKFYLDFIIEDE